MELFDAGVERYRTNRPGYTANSGLVELRDRIREYYRFAHVRDANNVIITVGLQEGLISTLFAITDPGDEIVLPEPYFPGYRSIAALLGLQLTTVPTSPDQHFSLDVERIASAITSRTRAIVLCHPNNPTGRIYEEASLRALVDQTASLGVWIVSDEVYGECYYGSTPPVSLGKLSDRAIVLSSLSKSCSMTGFRLGYVLAPSTIAPAIATVHQFNVTCAPTISQYLALVVFEQPKWFGVLRNIYMGQRQAMIDAVASELKMPFIPPEGGMFLFLDTRSVGMSSTELAEQLLTKADVITVPGSAFGDVGEGFLRVSFARETSELVEGIRRIGEFLRSRAQ
jgi:aspartate/methionine/tyrosine aminotransferase